MTTDPQSARPGPLSAYLVRTAWGIVWRYGILATAVIVEESIRGVPLVLTAEFAGLAVVGALIGLWHSRSRLAAIWRASILAVVVAYLAPALSPIYGYVIILALALLTLEPVLSVTARRRAAFEHAPRAR